MSDTDNTVLTDVQARAVGECPEKQPSLFTGVQYVRPLHQLGQHQAVMERLHDRIRATYMGAGIELRMACGQHLRNEALAIPRPTFQTIQSRGAHSARRSIRDSRREWGRQYACVHAVIEQDRAEGFGDYEDARDYVRDQLEDLYRSAALPVQEGLVQAALERIDLRVCPECRDIYEDGEGAYSDTHDEGICEHCADINHFHTEDGYFISEDDNEVERVFTSTMGFSHGESDIFREVPSDAVELADQGWTGVRYMLEEVAIDLGFRPNDYGEWGEFEDEDQPAGYHQSTARSPSFFREPPGAVASNPPLGLEIETHIPGRQFDEVCELLELVGVRAFAESDGSLDADEGGVEIITTPILATEWLDSAADVWGVFEDHDAFTTVACGTHVSIRRDFLSPLQEARLFQFLTSQNNAPLVRALAGRATIYNPDIDIGGVSGRANIGRHCGGLESYAQPGKATKKRLSSGRRHTPICFKNGCTGNRGTALAEWRMFAGIGDADDLRRTVGAVTALVRWTQPKAATGTTTDHRAFLDWLYTQKGGDYAYLQNHLQQPEFVLAEGIRSFNTWA